MPFRFLHFSGLYFGKDLSLTGAPALTKALMQIPYPLAGNETTGNP